MNRIECEGCTYYGIVCPNDNIKGCHYCFDTGNPRECPPGAECTRYVPGSRPKASPWEEFFAELTSASV